MKMKLLGSWTCLVSLFAVAWLLPKPAAHAGEEFPITIAQIKKELGLPTKSGDNVVEYGDKLEVSVSEGSAGLVVGPAGVELATKLFKSKLFTEAEGKALTNILLKNKGLGQIVGRFEVSALDSVQKEGTVLMTIKLAGP